MVFTSDNIFHRVPPFLHEALPHEWLDSLKRLQQFEADVLVPGHGELCDLDYIPEMSAQIQDWIDAVSDAIRQGMSLEDAQEKVSVTGRYPAEAVDIQMAQMVQRMNVTRLYEMLKNL